MACCTTCRSCGSLCGSGARALPSGAACAPSGITRHAISRAALRARARVALVCRGLWLQTCAQEGERLARRKIFALLAAPMAIFELATLQTALGDHEAMRDAQQLRVGEFDPRTGVTVIVHNLDAGGA